MGIKIDIKKKFIVNGKEYQSWEEVPDELGRFGDGGLSSDKNPPRVFQSRQSVVFNGKEYADLAAMPEDERKTLESILQTLKVDQPALVRDGGIGKSGADPGSREGVNVTISLDAYRRNKPLAPTASSRWLLAGIILLGVLWGVYNLLK